MIKAVQLNTLSRGGAARAALRLNDALLLKGVESVFLSAGGSRSQNTRRIDFNDNRKWIPERRVWKKIQGMIDSGRTDVSDTIFTLSYPGFRLTGKKEIADADIINLHWVAQLVSPETVEELFAAEKRVVWTLHDLRPFTGGCHYPAGCRGYEKRCSPCPQICGSDIERIPEWDVSNKLKRGFKDIVIVTPSVWLGELAAKSSVFRHNRIEVIPNSVEPDIFIPTEKRKAKRLMGIPDDAVVLMFGAEDNGERRKGFVELTSALDAALSDPEVRCRAENGKLYVLSFGHLERGFSSLKLREKNLGYVEDDERIALAYSASDVFVLPSREDNLPNTMLEAMSCGTPVLAFDTGGMRDMIRTGRTGETVEAYDAAALGRVISKYVKSENLRKKTGEDARQQIEKRYSPGIQGERYKELYADILRTPVRPRRKTADRGDGNGFPQVSADFFPVYRAAAAGIFLEPKSALVRLDGLIGKVRKILRKHKWRILSVCIRRAMLAAKHR